MLCNVRDTLIVIAAFLVCAAMLWLSYRIEPSWASKDGHRFLCVGQEIQARGLAPAGRMKEMRGSIHPDGILSLLNRKGVRRDHTDYHIIGPVSTAPAGKRQFLIRPVDRGPDRLDVVLRFREGSRAIAALEAVIARQHAAASEPSGATTAAPPGGDATDPAPGDAASET